MRDEEDPTGGGAVTTYCVGDTNCMVGNALGYVTIRSCLDCGILVAGGPTRCKACAAASTGEASPNMRSSMSDIERWRMAKKAAVTAASHYLTEEERVRLRRGLQGIFTRGVG